MNAVTIRAFRDELLKLAVDHQVTDDPKKIEKLLKPGDILNTQVRGDKTTMGKLMRIGLEAFQGSKHTHVGLYAGNGKIIDAGQWSIKGSKINKDEKGWRVAEVPLDTYVKRYKFRVLRVRDASKEEKKDAVTFAKKQLGKDFSFSRILRLALPVAKADKPARQIKRDEALQSMVCSQLVSNAYPKRAFGARPTQYVRPVDIQRSNLTKIVAEFE